MTAHWLELGLALGLGPRGFAAADGRAFGARNPGAIRDLLQAAGIAHSPAPAEAVVRRLIWLYQRDLAFADRGSL